MRLMVTGVTALLGVFLVTTSALARGVELTLCTARADGNYFAAGEEIKRRISPGGLKVRLLETNGSADNLERLAAGECDAGIVQIDAYFAYQEAHRAERLEIKRPTYLYQEFVHLICRADAGIASIEELAQRAHQPTVLIGAPNSGSAVTWDAFTVLDPSYASVPTREIGGSEALGLVNEGEGADCLMYVSGLHSNYLSSVNDSGAELRLVAVDDPDLDDAKFAGLQIYEFQPIPAGTYAGLQPGSGRSGVKTVTVGATMLVAQSWAEAHPGSYDLLVEATLKAKPAIEAQVSGRPRR